jgi:hypothetical protein
MEEVRIEPGESKETGKCPDCGSKTWYVNGYVYVENSARAVYYARWTDKHIERGIQILLSIGQWGDGTTGNMRRRVGIECRMGSDHPSFMVVDASKMPWDDEKFLGKPLTREQVLKDPAKEEVFQILDHLAFDDLRIKAFLLSDQHQ